MNSNQGLVVRIQSPEPCFTNTTICGIICFMSSYSVFERDRNGKIWRIHQEIDSAEMPENSTFVAFDAVAFARATGQLALIAGITCDSTSDSFMAAVDNRDNRWDVDANFTNGTLDLNYKAPGASTFKALTEHFGHPMYIRPVVGVTQHIDAIYSCDYVGDGQMSRMGLARESVEEGYLPAPGTQLAITDSGVLAVGNMSF
jgi:hypothetical protein